MPPASSEKAGTAHPRIMSDSRKRKRSSLPPNAQTHVISQSHRQNSDSPGIDSDTAHMLLGGSSDAEEAINETKHRKKRVNVNGGGPSSGAGANQPADSSYPQPALLTNGDASYPENFTGRFSNVSGFKSVNRDEGAGVAALLHATAEADRHVPSPQATATARRKANKSPQPQRAKNRQPIPGSGTSGGPISRPSLGSMPTLASLGLEDEQSKTRALAKLLVTVEQLQSRVTELEAAQFRAMEKIVW